MDGEGVENSPGHQWDTSVSDLEYRNIQESEKLVTPVLTPVSYYPRFALRSS